MAVHFFTNNVFNFFENFLAHGHNDVNAVGALFNHAGAHKQTAGNAVFILGCFAKCIEKRLR